MSLNAEFEQSVDREEPPMPQITVAFIPPDEVPDAARKNSDISAVRLTDARNT